MNKISRSFSLIMIGFIIVFLGMIVLMLSGSQNYDYEGVVVIFPFIFFFGTGPTNWFLILTVVIFLIFLFILPFLIFRDFMKVPFRDYEPYDVSDRYKICPVCETIVPKVAKYCWNCGYRFLEQE